jgi:hypothetical protein
MGAIGELAYSTVKYDEEIPRSMSTACSATRGVWDSQVRARGYPGLGRWVRAHVFLNFAIDFAMGGEGPEQVGGVGLAGVRGQSLEFLVPVGIDIDGGGDGAVVDGHGRWGRPDVWAQSIADGASQRVQLSRR